MYSYKCLNTQIMIYIGCVKAYLFIVKQSLTDEICIFLIANKLW